MTLTNAHSRKILVLHSEPIVAAGLIAALGFMPGFQAMLGDLARLHETPPATADVVVCDYATGLQLIADAPDARLVLLSDKPREFDIQRALGQGVLGYLVKGCGLDELEGAVLSAAAGRRYFCRASAQEIANGMMNEALTTRERDVLHLMARGSCNKAIANRLEIALGTVKAHVRSIMAKLKATSRTEAASIASARGLLPDVAMAHELPATAPRAAAPRVATPKRETGRWMAEEQRHLAQCY